MFVKQTSGFVAMKFVNFIAHYIMGKKKLRVCQLDAVLLVMGIVLRQFAKDCVDKMPVPDYVFLCKKYT